MAEIFGGWNELYLGDFAVGAPSQQNKCRHEKLTFELIERQWH